MVTKEKGPASELAHNIPAVGENYLYPWKPCELPEKRGSPYRMTSAISLGANSEVLVDPDMKPVPRFSMMIWPG